MNNKSDADKVKIIPLSEAARRRGVTPDAIINEAIEGELALYIREGVWTQYDIHSGDEYSTEFLNLVQVHIIALNDLLTLGEYDLQGDLDIYADNPDFNKATKISRRKYK